MDTVIAVEKRLSLRALNREPRAAPLQTCGTDSHRDQSSRCRTEPHLPRFVLPAKKARWVDHLYVQVMKKFNVEWGNIDIYSLYLQVCLLKLRSKVNEIRMFLKFKRVLGRSLSFIKLSVYRCIFFFQTIIFRMNCVSLRQIAVKLQPKYKSEIENKLIRSYSLYLFKRDASCTISMCQCCQVLCMIDTRMNV